MISFSFPIAYKPLKSITDDPRKFASPRDGRLHAGVDIYARSGTPVHAAADGKVIIVREFFRGTWAVAVDHGTFILRYCELDGNTIFCDEGDVLTASEQIGKVGKMPGIKDSMLHLEMYSKKCNGSLTDLNCPPFLRRADLVDPTPYLLKGMPK